MRNLDSLPLILGLAAIAIGVSALFAIVDDSPASRDLVTVDRQVTGQEVFARSFDIGRAGAIEVDVEDADVIIDGHDGDGVDVRVMVDAGDMEWAREVFASMSFQADLSGSTVRVEADDDDRYRDGGWDDDRNFHVVALISVPHGFDVSVATEDGDVEVGSLTGDVDLRSSDGDIFAAHLAGGNASVTTSDGDISVERMEAANGRIRTSDGDVSVAATGGALEARSSDGDIRIEIANGTELSVSTGDGDITLYAPSDYSADVDFSGEELSVSPDFTLLGQIDGGDVRGSINGGGSPLTARTGDGSIELRAQGG